MLKNLFSTFSLALIASTAFSQTIYYSSNKLPNISNEYKIIGAVKENFIVWRTILDKQSKSEIYIYNNSMQLINTVKTNILVSDVYPNTQFFTTPNSFFVAYEYKYNNAFLYKVTEFTEDGDIIATHNLDSIDVNDKSVLEKTFFYKFLQSANSKTICFTKMTNDSVHNILRFNCVYFGNQDFGNKDFVIPYDEQHDEFNDIAIDDDKNLLLLKQNHSESALTLYLVKKNYADDLMLVASKALDKAAFMHSPMHVAQKTNGYIVYGGPGKYDRTDTSSFLFTELYIWQTNKFLDDAPGDTVIKKSVSPSTPVYAAYVPSNTKFFNIFTIWNIISPEWHHVYRSSVPLYESNYLPLSGSILPSNEYERTTQGIYLNRNYNPGQNDYPSYGQNDYTPYLPYEYDSINTPTGARYNLDLFNLDNGNKIAWENNFTDSIDNVLTADLSGAKIIAANKAIHIIYEVHAKKRATTLNHIAVYADGTYTKSLLTAWNSKYDFNMDELALTPNNELLIPAKKGVRLYFAKIKLE